MITAPDHQFMARAIQLAQGSIYSPHPNPRVGCVITHNAQIIGQGWHGYAGGPHAEVYALAEAGERARGATAYVTLEPCSHHGRTPPCADGLIEAGIARVVMAMQDPNPKVAGTGIQRLWEAGIAVESGVMETQARALNPGFIKRMECGRPWVCGKLAMSLDGRTAMASGASQWITGAAARRDVQQLRAGTAAILTGIGTVLADDPSLTLRAQESGLQAPHYPQQQRQPLRVVVDSRLDMPATARMLSLPGETLIFTCSDDATKIASLQSAGAEVVVLAPNYGRVDLAKILDELGRRQINDVLVEAGSGLNGALLQAGLIDELIIYLAPTILGDAARGLFQLPGLEEMADRLAVEISDIRAVGKDWRICARPVGR